jgi:hypothetical protein
VLDEIYSGARASQRLIHEALMKRIQSLVSSRLYPRRVMSVCGAKNSSRSGPRPIRASKWVSAPKT